MSLMMLSSTDESVTMGSVRLRWMALCGFWKKVFSRLSKQTGSKICKTNRNSAYIEVVTVDSAANTPFLLRRKLLFRKLEH